jgi:hypothetical protein
MTIFRSNAFNFVYICDVRRRSEEEEEEEEYMTHILYSRRYNEYGTEDTYGRDEETIFVGMVPRGGKTEVNKKEVTPFHYRVAYTNIFAAGLHATCAILIVLLVVLQKEKSPDIVYELVTSVCTWREEHTAHDGSVPSVVFKGMRIQPEVRGVGMWLSTTGMVCAFAVLSCVFQAYWVFNFEGYLRLLSCGGVNAVRYLEYSVSASVMLVLIAVEVGLWDWGTLAGMAACSFACMMFGLLADTCLYVPREAWERWQAPLRKPWWIAHVCGWVCVGVPFWIILATVKELRPPSFVVAIVSIEAICFLGFGVTQFAYIWRHDGCARGVAAAELAYIVQSLVSKTTLGALVYSLVLADQF